jgi:hypothetical protein
MVRTSLQTILIVAIIVAALMVYAFIAGVHTFAVIKPGMTRIEVEKLFPKDGGLNGLSHVRFQHPGANYVKVDVRFNCRRDQDGRATISPDDKVRSISLPYLQRLIFD